MRAGLPDAVRGAATARDGVVLVDKPAGPTSHDVVALTRRLAATRRVGHAGTLDPAATGLLVLGVGRATRLLTYFVGADKTYEATVRLGQDTLTEDAEGEVTALTGRIAQVPSAVSAIRVDGVRSYARVRGGEDVVLPARSVTVHRLTRLGAPVAARAADGTAVVDLRLRVSCSSGTYVRALARDLGAALATGAHLTALRRTRVGPFTIDEARGPRDMVSQVTADAAGPEPEGLSTLSPSTVVRRVLPAVELDRDQSAAVRYGRSLPDGRRRGRGGGRPAPRCGRRVRTRRGRRGTVDPQGRAGTPRPGALARLRGAAGGSRTAENRPRGDAMSRIGRLVDRSGAAAATVAGPAPG